MSRYRDPDSAASVASVERKLLSEVYMYKRSNNYAVDITKSLAGARASL